MKLNLFTTIGVVFFINILEYFIAPITTILITKSLTVSDFGVYSFLMTLVGLMTSVCTLGLGQYNFRNIPGRSLSEQYNLLGKSLFVKFLSSLLGIFAIWLFFRNEFSLLLIIIFIIKIVVSIQVNEMLRFLGFRKRNIQKSVISLFNSRFWFVPLIFISLWSNITVTNIFITHLIGHLLVYIFLIFHLNFKNIKQTFFFDFSYIKRALIFSLPLVFVDLGMYLLQMGSRYILKLHSSFESIGLYSFAFSWYVIIFKFGMLIVYILQPYISESFYKIDKDRNGLNVYQSFLKISFKASFLLIFCAILFFNLNFDNIVLLVGKEEYLVTRITVLLLSPYPIFMFISYFFQNIMMLNNRTKVLPLYYSILAAVSLILNYFMVMYFDYNGAAIASTVSYLVLSLLMFIGTRNCKFVDFIRLKEISIVFLFIVFITFCNIVTNIFISIFAAKLILFIIYFFIGAIALRIFSKKELLLLTRSHNK